MRPLDLSDCRPGRDLAMAETMPARWYTEPQFLELEAEKSSTRSGSRSDGLKSKAYDRGRFSARRENGVHHFQSLAHEFLCQGRALPAD